MTDGPIIIKRPRAATNDSAGVDKYAPKKKKAKKKAKKAKRSVKKK